MFICQIGNHVVEAGKPMTKIVIKTRPKDYFEPDKNGTLVRVGHGTEIVKELRSCTSCAAIYPIF